MAQDTWYVYLTDDIKIFIYIAFFGKFSPFEDIRGWTQHRRYRSA